MIVLLESKEYRTLGPPRPLSLVEDMYGGGGDRKEITQPNIESGARVGARVKKYLCVNPYIRNKDNT